MIKKILTILTIIFIYASNNVFANENRVFFASHIQKEHRQINEMLKERLSLTNEQCDLLKKNHDNYQHEMKKIVSQMQKRHDKIRNVYLTGIPKFQADLRTAPDKAQLVVLKQNADKLRLERRKYFESILTPEQKIEFKTIKKELAKKKI